MNLGEMPVSLEERDVSAVLKHRNLYRSYRHVRVKQQVHQHYSKRAERPVLAAQHTETRR